MWEPTGQTSRVLRLFLDATVSQTFRVCFGEHRAGVLPNVPQLGFVSCVSWAWGGVMGFWEEGLSSEVLFSPHPWLGVCPGLLCQGVPSPFPDPSWTGASTYVWDFSAWETCLFPIYLVTHPGVYIAVDSQFTFVLGSNTA